MANFSNKFILFQVYSKIAAPMFDFKFLTNNLVVLFSDITLQT